MILPFWQGVNPSFLILKCGSYKINTHTSPHPNHKGHSWAVVPKSVKIHCAKQLSYEVEFFSVQIRSSRMHFHYKSFGSLCLPGQPGLPGTTYPTSHHGGSHLDSSSGPHQGLPEDAAWAIVHLSSNRVVSRRLHSHLLRASRGSRRKQREGKRNRGLIVGCSDYCPAPYICCFILSSTSCNIRMQRVRLANNELGWQPREDKPLVKAQCCREKKSETCQYSLVCSQVQEPVLSFLH